MKTAPIWRVAPGYLVSDLTTLITPCGFCRSMAEKLTDGSVTTTLSAVMPPPSDPTCGR